jgi:hypothetical protein
MGIEHTISVGERPQTYGLDRAATGTGDDKYLININYETPHYAVSSGLFLHYPLL